MPCSSGSGALKFRERSGRRHVGWIHYEFTTTFRFLRSSVWGCSVPVGGVKKLEAD